VKGQLFKKVNPKLFLKYNVGLEREGLRITKQGKLSSRNHPRQLGSSLTNPIFTTDFAEQQIEIISKPKENIDILFEHFKTLHSYALQNMDQEEILWNYSMPCHLTDKEVEIANFGDSNLGKFKTLYRKGLAKRYGKKMQTISGIHFNFSFSDETIHELYKNINNDISIKDFKSEIYLHICRNFLRLSPFLTYILGESPLYLQDFETGKIKDINSRNDYYYKDKATSFRMSDLGYSNPHYCKAKISYNSIQSYINTLKKGLTTECKKHKQISKNEQINSNVLQIEAEYYSSIRPKPKFTEDKRNIAALNDEGIEYIEFRGIDIDPEEYLGISKDKLYFLHLFILYTLSIDSPLISEEEQIRLNTIQKNVSTNGLDPNLEITNGNKTTLFKNFGLSILEDMKKLAKTLDMDLEETPYTKSVNIQIEVLKKTNKSKLITKLTKTSLNNYILEISKKHSDYLRKNNMNSTIKKQLDKICQESLHKQQDIKENDKICFAEYIKLTNYK